MGLKSRVHPTRGTVKVTFLNSPNHRDRSGYNRDRGQTVWSTLPSREVARPGRRALDTPDRTGPAAGPRTIPGPPCPAVRHPAEATCGPLTANGAPGPRSARALLEAPTASLVCPHRPRAWSRSRRGRPGGVGPAVRGSAIGPSARDLRAPNRAATVLPAL